jgi:hypothetical protein
VSVSDGQGSADRNDQDPDPSFCRWFIEPAPPCRCMLTGLRPDAPGGSRHAAVDDSHDLVDQRLEYTALPNRNGPEPALVITA